jgi:hypothetical protein
VKEWYTEEQNAHCNEKTGQALARQRVVTYKRRNSENMVSVGKGYMQ